VVVLLAVATVVFLTRGEKETGSNPAARPDARPPVTTELGVFAGAEPEKVEAFNDWLGHDVAYVMDFSNRQTWADIAAPQSLIDTWKDLPYRKVYGLAMLPADSADTIERGAAGEYNTYFADLAQRLVAGGQDDAILRLGWEFNLEDSRWATDDPASFIAYWRQVVTTMRAQEGQHFQFDWNPNNGDTKYDAVNYYPGSDVVDYIGVDAYDVSWASGAYPYPENCADDACWAASQKVAWDKSIYGGARGLKFWSGFARQQGKPLTLPEWGLWQRSDGHGGGNDPEYLRRMAAFIADPANRVAYQSYFEYDGPDGPHRLMTTFPQSGDVFRSLFGKPAGS
jgi:glycosyl hydrolase family 26